MIGKLIKTLFMLIIALAVFAGASIAGVRNDDKKEKRLALETEESAAKADEALQDITSPFPSYSGGILELQIDYEVQLSGGNAVVTVVSNLPDGYDLTAELSNVEDVKRELGFEGVSSSALTPEQMNSINEMTYSKRKKNFVKNGVSDFVFEAPPEGQLDLKVTSPITRLQPSTVQDILGEQGVNLQGAYVVYLEEVSDKSINFNASFILEGEGEQTHEAFAE